LAYLRANMPQNQVGTVEGEGIKGLRLIVQVVPQGPDVGSGAQADLANSMYWGRVMYIMSDTLVTDAMELWEDEPDADGFTLPFTCLAEYQGCMPDGTDPRTYPGPHAIPMGTILEVFPRIDAGGVLRWVSFSLPRHMVMLKVTGPDTGPGKYVVKEQIPSATDIPNTGAASLGEICSDGITTGIMINPAEIGGSGHDIMATDQRLFVGYLVRVNSDGTPVYLMAGGAGGSETPATVSLSVVTGMTIDGVTMEIRVTTKTITVLAASAASSTLVHTGTDCDP
jgi:hypothetical protein